MLTDEMVERAAETYWREHWGVFGNAQKDAIRQNMRLSLETALSAQDTGAIAGVRVKDLQWHKSHMPSWNGDWHTTTPFIYTVRCADENGWKWSAHGASGYAHSPEAAKAAAQADYSARILSALEPQERDGWKLVPVEPTETTVEKVAKALADKYHRRPVTFEYLRTPCTGGELFYDLARVAIATFAAPPHTEGK